MKSFKNTLKYFIVGILSVVAGYLLAEGTLSVYKTHFTEDTSLPYFKPNHRWETDKGYECVSWLLNNRGIVLLCEGKGLWVRWPKQKCETRAEL